jgi:ribosomal protein S18 acetylase RimI-like enzyme
VTLLTDSDLLLRGAETFLAAWEADAHGSHGAAVLRAPGFVAGVFPHGPERAFLNNALLARDLGPAERSDAVEHMEAVYAAAGVDRFAAWVHESDEAMRRELEARRYAFDTSTRAMGMSLDDIRVPPPSIEVRTADWSVYLDYVDALAPGLHAGVDPSAYRVVAALQDGEVVAAGLSFDAGDDCGIYNVWTLEQARRRGLGSAITARLVHDAAERGCRTATLQSTPMAERVYAAVGFRDLGRFFEYVPG